MAGSQHGPDQGTADVDEGAGNSVYDEDAHGFCSLTKDDQRLV